MNRTALQKLTQGTALYVVAHGLRQRQRGRRMSVPYGEVRAPAEAYTKAMADLEHDWELTQSEIEKIILDHLNGHVNSPLAGLEGAYVGFSPTDESAVAMGEMQLRVTPFSCEITMATGLKVEREVFVMGLLPITEAGEDEVRDMFTADIPPSTSVRMFKMEDEPWFVLIRDINDPSQDCIRLLMGEMAEILGPTILFTPERVRAGEFEEVISAIEADFGESGIVPRVATQGLAPREFAAR